MVSASDTFYKDLGLFYANHLSSELLIDYSIGKFLGTTDKQTHVLTTYVDFGRKCAWLNQLIKDSKHPKSEGLLKTFKVLWNTNRNVFAHSYLHVGPQNVTFIEKGVQSVREHHFTPTELSAHINDVVRAAIDYKSFLGVTDDELSAFSRAAMSRDKS